MSRHERQTGSVDTSAGILKLAILAVGGQGGGVLSNWIVDLARAHGWHVQLTSVAGVAQRTGATIYYIEMAPPGGPEPVFALAPAPGDVDVLIAAELMEAGRAVQRGFVTPDKTLLIASTHRVLATVEKVVPGDGRGDAAAVQEELARSARSLVAYDMEALAREAGSVISASLFGALARSGALPFEAKAFEEVIARSGRGVEASLRAFRAAFEHREDAPAAEFEPSSGNAPAGGVSGPPGLVAEWKALEARLAEVPDQARPLAQAALRQVVDYQDTAYGAEYLDHLAPFLGRSEALDRAAVKYIARAMCYDDLPRVADLKTRPERIERVRREQRLGPEEVLRLTEHFHPRGAEVCATLPAPLGAFVAARPRLLALLDRLVNRPRRLRTDSLAGFLQLWLVAGLRRWRRGLYRHRVEMAHLARLKALAEGCLPDAALAAEVLACQRLVKGYSGTHARGLDKFERVTGALDRLRGRDDAADWLRRLRDAALADEEGKALDGALKTVESFTSA